MKIMVIDVAAQYGGAETILNQFISKFKADKQNTYIVALSTLKYKNEDNVLFLNYEWVKKSHLHRLYFDRIYVNRLIRKYMPDKLLSLQNNAFGVKIPHQEVYLHNALFFSDKRFSIFESLTLWFYQTFIGKIVRDSMKYADKITVQADWIRRVLVEKWKLDEGMIEIDRPHVSFFNMHPPETYHPVALFYPANGAIYKNHITLLEALVSLWKRYHLPELRLIGKKADLPTDCQAILDAGNYPVRFLGRLAMEEMAEQYRSTILVFPSYIETVGLPLLEAKAFGTRIIAADMKYAREAVGDYNNVEFFSAFSACDLTKRIEDASKQYGLTTQKQY